VNSLWGSVSNHPVQAQEDEMLEEPRFSDFPGRLLTKVPLSNLLEFNSTYWESLFGQFTAVSFEQKFEMYELADLDVPGNNDDSYKVNDDSIEFILSV
jgi:hypothetical protein